MGDTWLSMHGCHGASIITKDPDNFTDATAEKTMEVVTLQCKIESKAVNILAQCGVYGI